MHFLQTRRNYFSIVSVNGNGVRFSPTKDGVRKLYTEWPKLSKPLSRIIIKSY